MIIKYFFNIELIKSIGISLILFFFIFGIPTPMGSLTPLLTMCIVFWAGLNYTKYFLKIPKEIFYLFIFLLFDLFVCLIIPYVFGTYDLAIIKTKINFIASLLAVYVLAMSFATNAEISDRKFFNILLGIFLIQIVLVILMLVNSDISNLITSFTRNTDEGARVLDSYAGARGLGFADSSVFGFAIVMGFLLLLVFFLYEKNFINFKYFIFLVLLGGVASISAGRTAILGLIIGLVYLFLNLRNIRTIITLASMFLIFIFSISLLLSIDRNSIQNDTLRYFYSYSMQPILNYIDTGSFATSSTEALQNMYFPLTERQFLIGDGRYMDGLKYYMGTDAGYMRFALFYGVIFSFFLYSYFTYFIGKIIFLSKRYSFFLLVIFLFTIMLHYKGEVILFAISYNKLLFLILFYIYIRSICSFKSLNRSI